MCRVDKLPLASRLQSQEWPDVLHGLPMIIGVTETGQPSLSSWD